MIHLNDLAKITENKSQRDKEEKLRREIEITEKIEKEYQEAISNLEQRLKDAANEGKRILSVAHFSAFYGGNISDKFHKKRKDSKNFFLSWNTDFYEIDIIENMQGNLKKVFDYLKQKNLDPKVYYWSDDMDEGFQLMVEW